MSSCHVVLEDDFALPEYSGNGFASIEKHRPYDGVVTTVKLKQCRVDMVDKVDTVDKLNQVGAVDMVDRVDMVRPCTHS
jgi:hypothetical protein